METKNNAVLNRIAETQAEIVQTARDDRNVRGLSRSSWLRVEPDQSAAPIRKLFPDELVRVRKAQDNWVEVEVFDYGGGATKDRSFSGSSTSARRLRLDTLRRAKLRSRRPILTHPGRSVSPLTLRHLGHERADFNR